MLDFSWSHILIVLIVALVVVGPKDLPRLARMVGQWAGKARRMVSRLREGFDDLSREAELAELREEIKSLRNERPLADLERKMQQPIAPSADAAHSGTRNETRDRARDVTSQRPAVADGYKPPTT